MGAQGGVRLGAHRVVEVSDIDGVCRAGGVRAQLTEDVPPGGEVRVLDRGDGGDLRRVLDNLLGNARAHTPAGTTVRVRVDEVRTGPGAVPEPVEGSAGGSVRLTVADDGPGLPAALQDTVFERFARGETSRSREGGGTGLGLAIARAVVEAHGGMIEVAPGPGATFMVTLPAARPDADPATPATTTLEG